MITPVLDDIFEGSRRFHRSAKHFAFVMTSFGICHLKLPPQFSSQTSYSGSLPGHSRATPVSGSVGELHRRPSHFPHKRATRGHSRATPVSGSVGELHRRPSHFPHKRATRGHSRVTPGSRLSQGQLVNFTGVRLIFLTNELLGVTPGRRLSQGQLVNFTGVRLIFLTNELLGVTPGSLPGHACLRVSW